MKKIGLILLCLISLTATAQVVADGVSADSLVTDSVKLPEELPYPAILEDMTYATVHQDSMITLLMQEKIAGVERGQTEMSGWRVQIYSSNSQTEAKAGALALQQQFDHKLDVSLYVIYTPPFWKVRIGDFKTVEEAQEYKKLFIEKYPELQSNTYVVRDEHIQLKR